MKSLSSENIAKQFLKDQISIMKRHGSAPRISATEYRQLVADTKKSFDSLRPPPDSPSKRTR